MDMRTLELIRGRLPREVRDIIYSYLWADTTKTRHPNSRSDETGKVPLYGQLLSLGPQLGFILSGEAAEWAYENIDGAELVETFMDAHVGLDLHHVRRYLREGIFDVHGRAPGELALLAITVAINCDSYDRSERKRAFEAILKNKHKNGFELTIRVFEISHNAFRVQPLRFACVMLRRVLKNFENRGFPVDVEAMYIDYADPEDLGGHMHWIPFRFPVTLELLGKDWKEWQVQTKAARTYFTCGYAAMIWVTWKQGVLGWRG